MIPIITLAEFHAAPAEVIERSGHLVTIEYLNDRFVVSTLVCNCPVIGVAVYANGRESNGNLQAVYVCEKHGVQTSHAQRLERDDEIAARRQARQTPQAEAIFGPTEAATRRRVQRSQRPTWGYSGRTA